MISNVNVRVNSNNIWKYLPNTDGGEYISDRRTSLSTDRYEKVTADVQADSFGIDAKKLQANMCDYKNWF